MIKVQNLTKRYGDKLAVDHLTFDVEKGDVLGFLGPNGAGKSTTMNMLTGYLSATDGKILISGIDIQEEPEKAKKRVGYLPEVPPLYTEMTVMEYLHFVMRLKKVKGIRNVDGYLFDICKKTGIEQVDKRLIRHLSKGYRQRVGIAQALIGDPEILILDEPTVGLDPKQITEIRELIRELGRAHTILLSSHILQEIQAVCNRIIIINDGKVIVDQKENDLLRGFEGEQIETKSRIYAVVVKGIADQTAIGLKGIPFVEKVNFVGHTGENNYSFELYSKMDIREQIFDLAVQKGWKILQLEERKTSLEEIFLQATQKQ